MAAAHGKVGNANPPGMMVVYAEIDMSPKDMLYNLNLIKDEKHTNFSTFAYFDIFL
jgi:hypothetical protein